MIQVKSIFKEASGDDGLRILVERIWPQKAPRGKRNRTVWIRDVSPSADLAVWFSSDPRKWDEFLTRYHKELMTKDDFIRELYSRSRNGGMTLVHGSNDDYYNTAMALKIFLEKYGRPAE